MSSDSVPSRHSTHLRQSQGRVAASEADKQPRLDNRFRSTAPTTSTHPLHSHNPTAQNVNPRFPLRGTSTNPPPVISYLAYPLPPHVVLLVVAQWAFVLRCPLSRKPRHLSQATWLVFGEVAAGYEVLAFSAWLFKLEPIG